MQGTQLGEIHGLKTQAARTEGSGTMVRGSASKVFVPGKAPVQKTPGTASPHTPSLLALELASTLPKPRRAESSESSPQINAGHQAIGLRSSKHANLNHRVEATARASPKASRSAIDETNPA